MNSLVADIRGEAQATARYLSNLVQIGRSDGIGAALSHEVYATGCSLFSYFRTVVAITLPLHDDLLDFSSARKVANDLQMERRHAVLNPGLRIVGWPRSYDWI